MDPKFSEPRDLRETGVCDAKLALTLSNLRVIPLVNLLRSSFSRRPRLQSWPVSRRHFFLNEVGMRHVQRILLSAALLLVLGVSARAQVTTATLVGLVRDTSNAVIPGATVVATHEGTGIARDGVTDS